MNQPEIIAIAALGKETHYICENDKLLWTIPEDLKRLKAITLGHPIIMGRKTFESIGRPLPGRTNIVLTRNTDFHAEGITVVHNKESALAVAKKSEGGDSKIIIFGGAEIYKLFLPETDRLELTLVDSHKKGTAKFPPYETEYSLTEESEGGVYDDHGTPTPYIWSTFVKK